MTYARSTRILHFGIAICILIQLLGEQVIGLPEPGHVRQASDALLVGVHEAIGALSLVLVCAYLMVTLDEATGRMKLFPWLDAGARTRLWQEIRRDAPGWLRGKIPEPEAGGLVAGTVHGAGIVLALILGLSGSLLFIGMGPHGEMTPDIRLVREGHSTMASLMWVFVIGHGGMAIAHEIRGHGIVKAMFRLGKIHD